ncbi:MAG: hypothetical protein VX672_01250 [Planctomycetota bacterium]|nr:hypothetical protein [Planctomycetota bacterium]
MNVLLVGRLVDPFRDTIADLRRGRGAAIRGLVDMIARALGVVLRESIR